MSGIVINPYLFGVAPEPENYVSLAQDYGAIMIHNQSVNASLWLDESGNTLHGTRTNGPIWSPTGGPGPNVPGYFSFNGTNQIVQVTNNPLIQLTDAITLIWWQRSDGNTQQSWSQILGKGNEGYIGARLVSTDATRIGAQVWDGNVALYGNADSATGFLTPLINSWEMFMMRYDGSYTTLHIINGSGEAQLVATSVLYTPGPEVNTTRFVYAAQDDYGSLRRYWRGDLAGGLLFDSVLTPVQFENLYNAAIGAGGPPPSYDLSGLAHNPFLEYTFVTTDYTGDPYDVVASATFTHTDLETYVVPLYFAGSNTWKLRFTGPRVGLYTFVTSSSHTGLNGLVGTATVDANPDTTAKGYLTASGTKYAYLTGIAGTPRTFLHNVYLRHSDAVTPAGIEQIGSLPSDSVARGIQIEANLTEAQAHGMDSIFVTGGHNWVQYPRAFNQTSTNVYPDETSFTIMEDLLQRAYNRGMFVHIWMWNDSSAGTSSANLAGGINGSTDVRLQRYLLGRLGAYPNWELNYGYDLDEWVTEAQVRTWRDNMESLSNLPRLYMARETEIGQVSDFNLSTDKLSVYAQDETTLSSGPYLNALDRFAASTGKPVAYLRRFLHTRDQWTMEYTRRAIWRFAMAGGASGIYGVIWTTPVNYPNPVQLKHIGDFWEERFKYPLTVQTIVVDGLVLRDGDVRQVVYKENTNSIQISIPIGQTNVPVVSLNTVGATYIETNRGLYNAGTHTISLGDTSDWVLSIGDFGLSIPPLADDYDSVADSLGAIMVHNQARSGGSWTDLSGNGFHAAEINAPTWTSSGGPGSNIPGYYTFNGTNQRLEVTSSGVPSLLDLTTGVTMVWWQREDGTQPTINYNQILGKGEEGYAVRYNKLDDTRMVFSIYNGTDIGWATTATNHTIINSWQMYMASWNGTTLRLWRIQSGVAVEVATDVETVPPSVTTSLFMYAAQDDRDFGTLIRRYWKGDIAGASVYDYALTTANFEALYNASL